MEVNRMSTRKEGVFKIWIKNALAILDLPNIFDGFFRDYLLYTIFTMGSKIPKLSCQQQIQDKFA